MPARAFACLATVVITTTVTLAPTTATATTATASTTTTTGAAGHDNGCRRLPPQPPGTSRLHHVRSGGLDRTYQLHLPAGYERRRDWPVVLAYHGRGNTGARTEEFSKLSELPAVVVYPNGVVGKGDDGRQAWQGAPYSAPGVDDVAFTDDLLDELSATLCVDERRVYATGKSNGAGLIAILACVSADRIAAIAPVAGAFYPNGVDCRPSRPVPVIEFHGVADATIPYAGDAERGLPPITGWMAEWVRRNRCAAQLPDRRIEPDVTVSRWRGCADRAAVAHVAVDGGGHTWPGADSYSGGGHTTQTIEAHEVLWRFVRGYRLEGSR